MVPNAGGIVDGAQPAAGVMQFQQMQNTASGKLALGEEACLGDNGFVPWPPGAVMRSRG